MEAAAKSLEAALPPGQLQEGDVVIHRGSFMLGQVVSTADKFKNITVRIRAFKPNHVAAWGSMEWSDAIWPVSMLYKVDYDDVLTME